MNEALVYDLTEQLDRIAGALENLGELLKPPAEEEPKKAPADGEPPHLSLFLEALPTWQYNCLRRKLLPAGLAAKILGVPPAQLAALTRHGLIQAKGGRYDILNLLMWLETQARHERIPQ